MLVSNGERLNDSSFAYSRKEGATIVTFFIPEDEVLMGLEHPLVIITSDEDGEIRARTPASLTALSLPTKVW